MNVRDFIQDWILGNDYCKGCCHSWRDDIGNMCLYDSVNYPVSPPDEQVIIRNPKTHKSTCNLYSKKEK